MTHHCPDCGNKGWNICTCRPKQKTKIKPSFENLLEEVLCYLEEMEERHFEEHILEGGPKTGHIYYKVQKLRELLKQDTYFIINIIGGTGIEVSGPLKTMREVEKKALKIRKDGFRAEYDSMFWIRFKDGRAEAGELIDG